MIILKTILLVCFLCAKVSHANPVRGHAKLFVSELKEVESEKTSPAVFGESRLIYEKKLLNRVDLDFAYVLSWSQLRHEMRDQSDRTASYRLRDANLILSDNKSLGLRLTQNIDRLSLSGSQDKIDWQIGRQAVTFGSARVISPVDVFRPYAYQTIDQEYRRGVDAVRVTYAVGETSEIDLGFVFGPDEGYLSRSVFLKYHDFAYNLDYDLLCILQTYAEIYGLALKGSFAGAGIWLDGISVQPREDLGKSYYSVSVGSEYLVGGGTYVFAELHRDSSGAKRVEDYPASQKRYALLYGGSSFLGRDYLGFGLSWQWTPLVNLQSSLLTSLSDRSAFAQIGLDYSARENTDIGIQWTASLDHMPGSDGGYNGVDGEFAQYPNFSFLSIRQYW